jgi:EpsI family protein
MMRAMSKSFVVSLALGMLMLLSSALAIVMTPVDSSSTHPVQVNLETLIPGEFSGWKLDLSNVSLIANPVVKGELERIYNQTISRTYVNKQGEHIMLSVAYGGEKKTDMHAHRPEISYAAGGFEIGKMYRTFVDTAAGRIPVTRLVAKRDLRNEPITYWIRVGDSLTCGWIEQKLTAIGYGLTGRVPDSLLVRVSSISNDEQISFRMQNEFLAAMLQAVRSEDRFWLVGRARS